MKKIAFFTAIVISVMACSPKGENTTATVNPHLFGEMYDSTAYMDVVKGSFKDIFQRWHSGRLCVHLSYRYLYKR